MAKRIIKSAITVATIAVLSLFILTGCNSAKKISFETFGGSSVASETVEKNGYASKPNQPTKANLVFAGWYSDAEYATVFKFDEQKITKNVTVYAKWVTGEDSFDFTINEDNNSIVITGLKVSGEYLSEIIIPSTISDKQVTEIADEAFKSKTATKKVVFEGQSVTKIGKYAFLFNTNLTEVVLPSSLVSIGEGAFASCRALSQINIPESVTDMGQAVFFDCPKLEA